MPIDQIEPTQAHQALQDNKDVVYLDVRTEQEFRQGHPVGAINIPIMVLDPVGRMTPNAKFVQQVEGSFDRQQALVIGCQAGGRSMRACQDLERVGYKNLANVMGGFGGGMNPMTGEVVKGWQEVGLPVEQGTGC